MKPFLKPPQVTHLFLLGIALLATPLKLDAQDSLLIDRNADQQVKILAFGDSITFGVGDGTEPGQRVEKIPFTVGTDGYPRRLSELLGVTVSNKGVPGEILSDGGVSRFPTALSSSGADLVLLMEGVNDAVLQVSNTEYQRSLQKIINVSKALGREIVLFTLTPSCCDHEGIREGSLRYGLIIQDLAAVNDLRTAQIEKAWRTTCSNFLECELFNLPEGLHPNRLGYDVIAQTAAATILGVDIFTAEGAEELRGALGLAEGAIVVKPEVQ